MKSLYKPEKLIPIGLNILDHTPLMLDIDFTQSTLSYWAMLQQSTVYACNTCNWSSSCNEFFEWLIFKEFKQ